jgi:hypothetical protein
MIITVTLAISKLYSMYGIHSFRGICRLFWGSQIVLLMFLLILVNRNSLAQIPLKAASTPFFAEADSQKLSLGINSTGFFKNNEYFSLLNPGYTLIGTIFQPYITYRPSGDTRIEAGWNFLKYDGREGFYQSTPIFRFQYQPVPWFQMVLGSIYGGENHHLIEPLYQWERAITHPVEDGVQFLFDTDRFNADVWLEWKKFIVPDDSFQEELLYGTTASYKLLSSGNSFNLSIPLQTTIEHHGGQINAHDSLTPPLKTIANFGSGLKAEWLFSGRIKQVKAECWVLGYQDLSPSKMQTYKSGYAFYPKAEVRTRNLILQCGYYSGNKYLSIEGDPLFLSANIPYAGVQYSTQELITTKLAYNKEITRGIFLAAYVEAYSNLAFSGSDYTYGVHLSFNREFFLARIR